MGRAAPSSGTLLQILNNGGMKLHLKTSKSALGMKMLVLSKGARALCRHGMEPLATLHHFVHPQWFEELGGFEKEENIPLFMSWVRLAFEYALISCTIPNSHNNSTAAAIQRFQQGLPVYLFLQA